MRKAEVFLLALVVAVPLSCSRPETKNNVQAALEQANLARVTVAVDEDQNIVHLRGSVDTMSDRSRAEEVASAAVGTSGRVLNELTVTGVDDDTAGALDREITDTLDRTLDRDDVLKERDVNFEVRNGQVTVTGEVRSVAEKNRVTEIARRVSGVRNVANGLEVRPEN